LSLPESMKVAKLVMSSTSAEVSMPYSVMGVVRLE
jgi:hypothetical protein